MACHSGHNSDSADLFALLANFESDYSPWVALGRRLGPEALCVVLEELCGQKVHVPTMENFRRDLERRLRDEQMRAQFNGRNYAELAGRYRLSEREVRRIIHGRRDRKHKQVVS